MPPPVVYVVVAIVGAAAAALAFKEFVYEPHIAPKLESWAEDFLEQRRIARNRRAVPVPASRRRRRDSSASSHPPQDSEDTPLNNSRDRNERERASGSNGPAAEAFELDGFASKEVAEWRNEVLRIQETGNQGLRRRRMDRSSHDFDGFETMSSTLDESFTTLTHTPLGSTHVISNVSSPMTPSTVSLPPTPTSRRRSQSQSTATQGEGNASFVAPFLPPSPIRELPQEASSAVEQTPRQSTDQVHIPTSPSAVTPLAIPNAGNSTHRSPANDSPPFPLPFTPTYSVMADDSPFGPLLPDTPRSSAEMYGEAPFSPLSRVMGSSSASTVSRGTLSSRANSVSSLRTIGNSGSLRRASGLVNEVVMNDSDSETDEEDTQHTSHVESLPANGTLASIASLSERYPAPPTPPVVVSPPMSSIGIISAPSSPRSGGSEVVINFSELQSPPQPPTLPFAPMLQVPSDPPSRSQSRSPVHSATSPSLSFASFLSPAASRAPSESEGDEFMSVADDESDWGVRPPTAGELTGPVQDRANNPFLTFERVSTSGAVRETGSDESVGSDDGSDDSWGSARRH